MLTFLCVSLYSLVYTYIVFFKKSNLIISYIQFCVLLFALILYIEHFCHVSKVSLKCFGNNIVLPVILWVHCHTGSRSLLLSDCTIPVFFIIAHHVGETTFVHDFVTPITPLQGFSRLAGIESEVIATVCEAVQVLGFCFLLIEAPEEVPGIGTTSKTSRKPYTLHIPDRKTPAL